MAPLGVSEGPFGSFNCHLDSLGDQEDWKDGRDWKAWEGLEGLTMVWQGLEGLGMVCRVWQDLNGLGRIFKTCCPLSHTVRGVAVGAAASALSRTARRIAYLSL